MGAHGRQMIISHRVLVNLDGTRVISVCDCLLEKQVGGLLVLNFPEIFILLFLWVIIAY